MAQLFKKRRLENKAQNFEIPDFEAKIEEIKKWERSYIDGSLKKKNESQCEQAFNQSFFEKVLGYTPMPADEYTYEPKANVEATGQKPDAVLAYFQKDGTIPNRVGAVVEIKDVNVPLDRPQKRKNPETPIQQGFRYKGQYKRCDFVIATNFYDIRLLKDNQLDYQQWTLSSLVDPKSDYLNFRTFYYLLCADNLLAKRGDSKTESLLSEIRVEQKNITDSFYAEYKGLRKELIKDIVRNNSVHKEQFSEVVEKSQKIIDRLVFVAFCEDLDLLPENTLGKVIKHAQNGLSNVWDTMKGFFNAVDCGSIKLGIPDGYNGELFKPDSTLDTFKISDEICEKFLEIGKYDFSEDLSVNILGHIFEQSISDLEELKAIGSTEDLIDPKKSKRKKDGIFYTPEYIVDYIVRNSVGTYLLEKEAEILEKHGVKEKINDKTYQKRLQKAYLEYREVLKNIKVLDPACGSGAFLVNVFDFLLAENERVGEILGLNKGIADFSSVYKAILQNNIYGVDLNPESVEITKLSLWLKTAQKGKKLATLNQNIKCGNSLIDDPEIAGERAFKWEDEFKDILSQGGFDVVVGNPPYVFARGNFSEKEKEFYSKNYQSSEYQVNLFVLFSEKAISLVRNSSFVGFIIPNTLLKISSISKLRKFMLKSGSIKQIIQFFGYSFPNVSVETITFIFKKGAVHEKVKVIDIETPEDLHGMDYKLIDQKPWQEDAECRFQVEMTTETINIINKIRNNSFNLEDKFDVKAGLKAYESGKGNPKQSPEDVKNRIYDSNSSQGENTYRYLEGKDVEAYFTMWSRTWLKYGEMLAAPRTFNMFSEPRILIREITRKHPRSLICTYCDETYLNNLSIVNILSRNKSNTDLKTLLLILSSSLLSFYFQKNTPKSDRKMFPKIILKDLKQFPIKLPENCDIFVDKADLMISMNKEFYEKNTKFIKLLQHEYQLEKISRKVEKYWDLDFDEFVKQLKLKDLSLEAKSELLDFFEKNKNEALELKNKIDTTDNEIDELVFDLYELTNEEKELIRNI